jgi:phosphoribosylglycinamide formyltransferase-1
VANLAVLASGNGSNFQAIVERLRNSDHRVVCLICNKREAYAFERARALGVPAHLVTYAGRTREQAEREMLEVLGRYRIDLIALAGFMKLLTPLFIDAYPGRVVNIHPALLPAYPGTDSIRRSFEAGERRLGITIHRVDYGTDTGPIIAQYAILRKETDTLEETERAIHELEHTRYPEVLLSLLDEYLCKE